MTPLSPDGSAVPPTRGGGIPYTGGTASLHGGNGFPTRSKGFPCAGAEGIVQTKKGKAAPLRFAAKSIGYAKAEYSLCEA